MCCPVWDVAGFKGFTALGGAAAAGAGEWAVRTLLAAGCSAQVPGDERRARATLIYLRCSTQRRLWSG